MAASSTKLTDRQHKTFIENITVKTMTEMLQKLIPRDVNPAFICTSYRNDMDKYNIALKLSENEQKIVANLNSDGFKTCDTPLLYKLCQYFDFVGAPLEGWGKFNDKLQNIGDAVEAIVKLRYENISNPNQDFKKIFDRMIEIAKVVDKELVDKESSTYLHGLHIQGFESAVKSLFFDKLDDRYSEKVKIAFQQMTEEAANGSNGSFEDDVLEEAEPICFDQEYETDIWKKPIVLSPALFGKAESDSNSEIHDINKLHVGKQGDSKCVDVLPCSKRSLRSRKRNAMTAQLGPHSLSSKIEADMDHA